MASLLTIFFSNSYVTFAQGSSNPTDNDTYASKLNSIEDVIDKLELEHEGFSWNLTGNGLSVEDVYNVEAPFVSSTIGYIQDAIDNFFESETEENATENSDTDNDNDNADSNDYYVGCGPLAIMCQLLYLGTGCGYYQLNINNSYDHNKQLLFEEILTLTETINMEWAFIDLILGLLSQNKDDDGILTLASEAENTLYEILNSYGLIEKVSSSVCGNTYSDDSFISINRYNWNETKNMDYEEIINVIMDSINNGMPVLAMSGLDMDEFSKHYMNICGYEYFLGNNSTDENITKLYFKVRMNLSSDEYLYLDSSYFDDLYINSSFKRGWELIVLEEKHQKISIAGGNHLFDNEYYNSEKNYSLNASWLRGNSLDDNIQVSSKYKRCATFFDAEYKQLYDTYGQQTASEIVGPPDSPIINYYTDSYLILSPNSIGCGESYIEYTLNKPIDKIDLGVHWFNSTERMQISDGKVFIEYANHDDNWTEKINLLYDLNQIIAGENCVENITIDFPHPVTKFRIRMMYYNPNSYSNGSRFVIDYLIGYKTFNHQCDTVQYNGSYTSSHHIVICNGGLGYEEKHSLNFTPLNNNSHRETCLCGYTSTKFHVTHPSSSNSTKAICVDCGYLVDLQSGNTIVGPFYNEPENEMYFVSDLVSLPLELNNSVSKKKNNLYESSDLKC